MTAFAQNLEFGKIGESDIAYWLRDRNNCVLPIYEKEIDEGKGPRLFGPNGEHIAPDMLVLPEVEWIEAKHKSVFTWHRLTRRWVTGIDHNHYLGYQETQRASGKRVWLLFLHKSNQPDSRDKEAGCPVECPTGLFGGSLSYLTRNENHDHPNWGRHGMVYWADTVLKKFAELEEVWAAKVRVLERMEHIARLA